MYLVYVVHVVQTYLLAKTISQKGKSFSLHSIKKAKVLTFARYSYSITSFSVWLSAPSEMVTKYIPFAMSEVFKL